MADVSGAGDGGQPIGRAGDERAGLGLLARFLGAVFLVMLGGLSLLDRALFRANSNQARLDAQSAGLLTESFVNVHRALLDRVAAVAAVHSGTRDSVVATQSMTRIVSSAPGLRRLWVLDTAGKLEVDIAAGGTGHDLSPEVLARLRSLRSSEPLSIAVLQLASGHALVALVSSTAGVDGRPAGTAGIAFDGTALRDWLDRTNPDTRLSLVVMSGADTIAALGHRGGRAQVQAEENQIIRLPTGGTWQVRSAHALTTQSLRWALWALGIFGVSFLALGLLREQRRALDVADRSNELERLYSDVKRANQAKSEFLANVSHELRTPLNAIVGFVELLRDGFYGDLSPRQVPPVDRIAASATHLRHLVDQVLDIAKIAAGRLEVHAETIVLRPFVLNVASELESLVSEKGLAFSITVGASLPRVRTDPTHLRQILINLIGNAVKYTQTGTVSVRARLIGAPPSTNARTPGSMNLDEVTASALLARAPRSGVWIALQIVDTGVGVSRADLDRIFDEFEQVDARARGNSMERGTGLGLAISRRLARLLGGEISVDSEVGRGSTFTIWLPVNPSDLTRERVDFPSSGVPKTAAPPE